MIRPSKVRAPYPATAIASRSGLRGTSYPKPGHSFILGPGRKYTSLIYGPEKSSSRFFINKNIYSVIYSAMSTGRTVAHFPDELPRTGCPGIGRPLTAYILCKVVNLSWRFSCHPAADVSRETSRRSLGCGRRLCQTLIWGNIRSWLRSGLVARRGSGFCRGFARAKDFTHSYCT